jgi:hypothetical protein
MLQPGEVSEHVRDQGVAPVECDVPVGWSLAEWRTVRRLAREVTTNRPAPWWRRLIRASHRTH